ncbi:MAG: APC family permease [Verrucomicrobia bacterium]|nr:APC family permease [Verrucomicrobiota bacterium]
MKNWLALAKNVFIGKARSLSDEKIFHKVSLIAVFAWVGLGADGLSSSCYGPEAAFLALKQHTFLSVFVALASVFTVVVICASYSQIIELFPAGGGGYLVASKLLSPRVGVVSGCALIVDYVLTIAISIASGADALFSLAPSPWLHWKLAFGAGGVVFLTLLNLRGVRESVLIWVPVFFLFLLTHGFAIGYALFTHAGDMPQLVSGVGADVSRTYSEIGLSGLLVVVLRAYSLGAGTYTGIEAVSNGLPVLREPRVQTGRRTMLYMGLSLALTVAGLLVAYLLFHVTPVAGKTLNAVLFEQLSAHWPVGVGKMFVFLGLFSAAALLFIAAQAGFLDGPRVMANLALDRWFPARFATLSDRLVTQNGTLLMGGAALLVLLLAHGSVELLVVLYSINVFITFSLSQLGMVRHWWLHRATESHWRRKLFINGIGLVLTGGILISLCFAKFFEGGWVTLVATGALVFAVFWIHRHYQQTREQLRRLDELARVAETPSARARPQSAPAALDPQGRTAVILVNGFNGLGLHTLFAVVRMFPNLYQNFVFAQVGVIDAGNFKGATEVENLRRHVDDEVERYATYMRAHGSAAQARFVIGTDVVEEATQLCAKITRQFPNSQIFAGQLVFPNDSFLTRLLHNYTVFALQRRFYREGWPMLILPIRV